jgi:hypothetical protein
MKYSKNDLFSRMFKIPEITFEDRALTSVARAVIDQPLLRNLNRQQPSLTMG